MDTQGMESLLGGLSQGLNGYVGGQIQQKRQQQNQANQSQLQLGNQETLELFKQTMAGKIDPNTASQISPRAAKLVNDFNQQNGRMPSTDEFTSLLNASDSDNDTTNADKAAAAKQKAISSALQKAQSSYNSDYKTENSALMAANTAGDQVKLALNNPVAYSAVPVTLARMMTGMSRINQMEIQRLGGSQAILDKANQIGTQMAKGTITPDNANWMNDLVNVLKSSHQQNIEDLGVHHASQYRQISGEDLPTAYNKVVGSPMPDRFNHPLGNPNIQTTPDIEAKKAALRQKLGL